MTSKNLKRKRRRRADRRWMKKYLEEMGISASPEQITFYLDNKIIPMRDELSEIVFPYFYRTR